MTNIANSLAGLSLLGGGTIPLGEGFPKVESRAVRAARAQFTLPPVVPEWRTRPSAQLSEVLRAPSLIERDPPGRPGRLAPDIANSFTAYRALEGLRVLAEASSRGVGSSSALQERFTRGLAELEQWLTTTESDKLVFSFGRASRRADTIALPPAQPLAVRGSTIAANRDAPLSGLNGTERFTVRVSRPGTSDTFSIDLSALPQPPRLDAMVDALNAAISSVPQRDALGNLRLDAQGNAIPRYSSRFAAVRAPEGGWGLELRGNGIEEVSLRQQDAADAVMVTAAFGDQASATILSRIDLAASAMQRVRLGELTAVDREATALLPRTAGASGAPPPVTAPLSIAASVTDADGFTYAVGTTRGSLGAQVGDGTDDLALFKLDSRGQQVWQRALGTGGTASGIDVALGADGAIVVGGTMTPAGSTDRDLLVARFSQDGGELSLSQLRQLGDEQMGGMAMAADGSVFVGARSSTGAITLSRVDVDGRVSERVTLDGTAGSQLRGLAVDGNGDLLALTQNGTDARLQRFSGGVLAASPATQSFAGFTGSTLAVGEGGQIAIGGQRGADAAVAMVDGADVRWTEIASSGEDRIDGLVFHGDDLFVAGRTGGVLGAGPRQGIVDAFIARVDAPTGGIEEVRQWGQVGTRSGPVTIALAPGGTSAVHALGFNDGVLNGAQSRRLVDQTALRPGDSFAVRVNNGPVRTIAITADDTAMSLSDRVSRLLGRSAGRLTIAQSGGSPVLRFEPAAGQRIDLLAGPVGSDALAKLGLAPASLVAPPTSDPNAPRVRPGGHYGFDLSRGLSLRDTASSRQALDRLETAVRTVRAGFQSLFWDDTKAALADGAAGGNRGRVSPYLASQVARYRDALARFGG